MANNDYIKRITAKQTLVELSAELDAETVQRCIEALNKVIPADVADVAKVRHGEWITRSWGNKCSICGAGVMGIAEGYNYCPNCGAKMDGKENNE